MKKVLLFVSALIVFTGCVDCDYPPYYESDIVFNDGLVGQWRQIEDASYNTSRAVFEKKDDRTYTVIFDEGKPQPDVLDATLFKIGGFTYIDFVERQPEGSLSQLEPKHSVWRIDVKKDFISLEIFDKQWFDELVEKNKADIGYKKNDYVYSFTAETKELRRFFIEHEKNLFTKKGKIKYERIKP